VPDIFTADARRLAGRLGVPDAPGGHGRGGALPGMLFAASCGITWRQISAACRVTKSACTEPYERKENILWQPQATKE
jgi:hypothetical protein